MTNLFLLFGSSSHTRLSTNCAEPHFLSGAAGAAATTEPAPFIIFLHVSHPRVRRVGVLLGRLSQVTELNWLRTLTEPTTCGAEMCNNHVSNLARGAKRGPAGSAGPAYGTLRYAQCTEKTRHQRSERSMGAARLGRTSPSNRAMSRSRTARVHGGG